MLAKIFSHQQTPVILGLILVGNMGSSYRKAYTVLGDHVNLGSRLEGLTKNYGVKLIISEYTYLEIQNSYAARLLDKVRGKGRSEALAIYEPLRTLDAMSEQEMLWLRDYQQACHHYYDQQWSLALKKFQALLKTTPDDKTLQIYIERCSKYLVDAPPKNWDGIFTHMNK